MAELLMWSGTVRGNHPLRGRNAPKMRVRLEEIDLDGPEESRAVRLGARILLGTAAEATHDEEGGERAVEPWRVHFGQTKNGLELPVGLRRVTEEDYRRIGVSYPLGDRKLDEDALAACTSLTDQLGIKWDFDDTPPTGLEGATNRDQVGIARVRPGLCIISVDYEGQPAEVQEQSALVVAGALRAALAYTALPR